jgi:hypothetical protein
MSKTNVGPTRGMRASGIGGGSCPVLMRSSPWYRGRDGARQVHSTLAPSCSTQCVSTRSTRSAQERPQEHQEWAATVRRNDDVLKCEAAADMIPPPPSHTPACGPAARGIDRGSLSKARRAPLFQGSALHWHAENNIAWDCGCLASSQSHTHP